MITAKLLLSPGEYASMTKQKPTETKQLTHFLCNFAMSLYKKALCTQYQTLGCGSTESPVTRIGTAGS